MNLDVCYYHNFYTQCFTVFEVFIFYIELLDSTAVHDRKHTADIKHCFRSKSCAAVLQRFKHLELII